MRENRVPSTTRFDFDAAVVDFMQWVEARENERKPGHDTGPKLGKNQVFVQKYGSLNEIFDLYGEDDQRDPALSRINPDEVSQVTTQLETEMDTEF